ncbi:MULTISPECIES: putative metalloprotease CJM1_0395 family protein [unclassified Shewanella]|uniref:putative metalloprotease CJM1_0395 family protein n=1 Tax=unclassified Shewanella TaxID=196818 RepID=UPI003552CDAC
MNVQSQPLQQGTSSLNRHNTSSSKSVVADSAISKTVSTVPVTNKPVSNALNTNNINHNVLSPELVSADVNDHNETISVTKKSSVLASSSSFNSSTIQSSTIQPSSIQSSSNFHAGSLTSKPLKTQSVVNSSHLSPQFNLKSGPVSVLGVISSSKTTDIQIDGQANQIAGGHSNSVNTSSLTTSASVSAFEDTTNDVTSGLRDSDKSFAASTLVATGQKEAIANVDENTSTNESNNDIQSDNSKAEVAQKEQVKQDVQDSHQAEQEKQQVQLDTQIINELSKRDAEVKTHEQAHAAVGGSFAQTPQYTYEKGPDGKRYAVEGEVKIDVGVIEGNAQATFNKMQKVYAAAMAPVQPSTADIQVANEAVRKMNEAKKELVSERQEKVLSTEESQQINQLAQQLDEQQFTPTYPFDQTNDEGNEQANNASISRIKDSAINAAQEYSSINIAV